jgi:RHS repeat-associated protein
VSARASAPSTAANLASVIFAPESNYVSIARNAYTNLTDAVFPYQNFDGALYVVNQATISDPSSLPGVSYYQTYAYTGAWTNLQGRGFQAFELISTYDNRNELYDYKYFNRSFPGNGMLLNHTMSGGYGFYPLETSNTTTSTTLDATVNNTRYFPYFSNVTTTTAEINSQAPNYGDTITTTSTTYSYDNYGNATNIISVLTDSDPNSPYTGKTWTTNVTNTTDISVNQSADLAAWCLNMLDETQVSYSSTLSGSTSVTRTKTFTPDTPSNCRILTTITEPTANSGLYKVTEALTFDGFGNVATDTVTGANMPSSPASRERKLNWGTTGQFLSYVIDPSGAETQWVYQSPQSLIFGVPDNTTNPNSLVTSWGYDAYGRKTSETRPDGTSTTWAWSLCSAYCGWSNSVYQVAQTAYQTDGRTVIRADSKAFDPADRVAQTAGPTIAGTISTVQTQYNNLGLLADQSLPFLPGAGAYLQSYAYDILNRLIEFERPVNAASKQMYCNPTVPPISGCQGTAYFYAGRKLVMTDPRGNTKTTITDVNGWLRQTMDAIGYNITQAYDSAGSVIGVTDSVGNTLLSNVTYNYGIQPFKVAATDADLGAWSYTVDSLGETTAWTDANHQSFSMTYDSLSRPATRTEPDLFTQWQYGSTPSQDNVGQLIYECTGTGTSCGTSPAYSETRKYDAKGRLSTRAILQNGNPGNDPGGEFLFTYGYSTTTGLLSSLTYPISTSGVALNLQYGYANGALQTVTDSTDSTATCGSTCTLWTANAMSAFGQVTQEALGNGVVTNRIFDAVTSWLNSATAGVGGGTGLINQSYSQDGNGNVIQRLNVNNNLTENFYYDADNRLCAVVLGAAGGCTSPTIVYDYGLAGPGNITNQTGVGAYTYPVAGQPRPHAVTSLTGTFNGITNPPFSYDSNGNMTNRAGSTVYWSSYNYPTLVEASDAAGNEEVQFFYGPDRQRYEQIYSAPGMLEHTCYIGGLMDMVFNSTGTDYRHYIYAGTEPIAIYSRTSGGSITMRYFLEDHQGGVSTIASNSGASDINESFTAFGQRRNPATWSGPPSTSDLNTIAGISRQGYTFQTWLGQSMGLNHMNGRVQDAILGRFLSADPTIPDPSNAQSYNRYTYVNNNPLTMADPTGFSALKPCSRLNGLCADTSCAGLRLCSADMLHSGVGIGGFDEWMGAEEIDIFAGIFDNSAPWSGDDFDSDSSGVTILASKTYDGSAAQATNSGASLDYIAINATYVFYDSTNGTILSVPAGAGSTSGNGDVGTYVPFAATSSVDPDRAYQALLLSDAAHANHDDGEAGRQMDIYLKWCGCSTGPAYQGMTFSPAPLPTQQLPPIAPPAIGPTPPPTPTLPNLRP